MTMQVSTGKPPVFWGKIAGEIGCTSNNVAVSQITQPSESPKMVNGDSSVSCAQCHDFVLSSLSTSEKWVYTESHNEKNTVKNTFPIKLSTLLQVLRKLQYLVFLALTTIGIGMKTMTAMVSSGSQDCLVGLASMTCSFAIRPGSVGRSYHLTGTFQN